MRLAIMVVSGALARNPTAVDLHEVLANLYAGAGDSPKAEAQMREVFRLRPGELARRTRLALYLNDFSKPVELLDGATINVNARMGDTFRVRLGGNRTLANPSNLTSGQQLFFRIRQDDIGSRTLAYGSKFKFPGGAPVLSTAAASLDILACQYDANDDTLVCVLNNAVA